MFRQFKQWPILNTLCQLAILFHIYFVHLKVVILVSPPVVLICLRTCWKKSLQASLDFSFAGVQYKQDALKGRYFCSFMAKSANYSMSLCSLQYILEQVFNFPCDPPSCMFYTVPLYQHTQLNLNFSNQVCRKTLNIEGSGSQDKKSALYSYGLRSSAPNLLKMTVPGDRSCVSNSHFVRGRHVVLIDNISIFILTRANRTQWMEFQTFKFWIKVQGFVGKLLIRLSLH